jgi:cytochrome c551/c552
MMRKTCQHMLLTLLTTGFAVTAQASAQLAVDQGCFSCHGANLRGEAPTFDRLAGKLAKYKGDAAAQARFVAKYRSGEPLERIDAHERLSQETATALVLWLAEGAK